MEASMLPSDTAQALQDSETRLQQVLDNTSALVFAKDHDGRYLFVNREFEVLSGISSAQMIGRTDEEIFPPDLAARFRHNDLRVLRDPFSAKPHVLFYATKRVGGGVTDFRAVKLLRFA